MAYDLGENKAKPPESGDLYDVITNCGEAQEHVWLRPKVEAAGVRIPLVITSYRLPDSGGFAFISHCFKYQVDTKVFISLL